ELTGSFHRHRGGGAPVRRFASSRVRTASAYVPAFQPRHWLPSDFWSRATILSERAVASYLNSDSPENSSCFGAAAFLQIASSGERKGPRPNAVTRAGAFL